MKWDVKLFMIFVLTILAVGLSFFFTHGKFMFPLEYMDLGTAAIAMIFVFATPFSQYSPIKFLFGLSLTYMLFGVLQMTNGPTYFMLARNFTVLLFAIFLLVRVFRDKNKDFRGLFLFFGLLVLMQMLFNGINFSVANTPLADLIKSILGFILVLLVLKQAGEGQKIKIGVKRMFILIGLYTFRNMVSLISEGDF